MESYRSLGIIGCSFGIIISIFITIFLFIGSIITDMDITILGVFAGIIYIIGLSIIIVIKSRFTLGIIMFFTALLPIFMINIYAIPASIVLFIAGVVAVVKE